MSWVTGESRNLQLKLCVTRSLFCSILPFCVKFRLSDHRRIQDHLKMTFSSMQNSSFSILRLFFFELKMLQEFFFVLSWTCSLKKRQSSAGGQIQSRQNQHHAQVSWRSSPGGIRWWNRSLHGARSTHHCFHQCTSTSSPFILSPKNHNSSKKHIDPFYLVEPLLSLLAGLNPSSGV